MITTAKIAELRKILGAERAEGRRVGFVPTMGALHDGHRSLIARARQDNDCVVVSIFVNPTQFGSGQDLSSYPRTLDADLELCDEEGAGVVFYPDADEMYPDETFTTVHLSRLTETMEGAHRPGHFDGVALVCTKLFNIVGECSAYFGEKDAQQLRVIERLVRDLDIPVDVVRCPTVRDRDGLALSSRNMHLSERERALALALPRALATVARFVAAGSTDVVSLEQAALGELGGVDVEYIAVVDPVTLEPCTQVDWPVLVCGAIRVGATRLIDNVTAQPPTQEQETR